MKASTLLLALSFVAAPLTAQTPAAGLPPGMTPEQAAALLQQNPELARLLQNQLLSSGMTPEEVRARLLSAGVASSTLDPYLPTDSAPPTPPGGQANALGMNGFTAQDSAGLYGDSAAVRYLRDSLRIDSVLSAELRERLNPKLKVFGLDAFRRPTTEFRPLASGPVDQNYRLGPGDGLALILTGEIETAHQLDVSREGMVFIPDIGQVFVNNLSLAQLRDVLYTRLGRVYSGISRRPDARSRFAVEVTRVRSVAVRVAGEVARPGSYQVGATGGALNAIYEAGGLNERATFRAIRVQRGADSVGTLDLYRYLLTGISPTEIRLDAGDVVFVPTRGTQVRVAGEVVRPAIYELKAGEDLRDLIRIAGGLTPQAAVGNVTIARTLPPDQRTVTGRERTVVTVDLRTALDPSAPATSLFPDDSITVFSVRGGRTTSVTIAGSVWQPGTYRLDAGMRLWDLIRTAGGLRPETYSGRAQIVRSRPDSTRVMVGVVLDSLAPANNPTLAELDNITVYRQTEFRPERYIGVYGAVRKPGMVSFSDSMTLRDAVLLAGGTTEDAYLAQAEVSRVRMDGTTAGDTVAVALHVTLDSTFVTDPTGYLKRPVGAPSSPAVTLEPYDNIYIRRQPGLEAQRTVVLSGEVRFPGRYSLLTRDERLTDLVARAGGLTTRAYTGGIRFYRRQLDHLRGSGLLTPPESERLEPQRLKAPASLARMGVDLPRVLENPEYKDNLTLANGDSIYIPTFIPVVLVQGAVNAPTAVTYLEGAGREYYVERAGGYMRAADKQRVYIEQPNGHIQKSGTPAAGAVIVVPAREPVPPNPVNLISLLAVVAQVITAATAIVVVLVNSP